MQIKNVNKKMLTKNVNKNVIDVTESLIIGNENIDQNVQLE